MDSVENVFVDVSLNKNCKMITANDFHKNPKCLDKCKMTELRNMLKYYKTQINFKPTLRNYSQDKIKFLRSRFKVIYDFTLIGTKPKLMDRLSQFFKLERASISIQRQVRGFFVRLMLKLRGPALKNRKLCVNETDFYTLDPVEEIPMDEFFSYKDDKDFVYGFEMNSLLMNMKIQSIKMANPYTRESMSDVILNIKRVERLRGINSQKKSPLDRAIEIKNDVTTTNIPPLRVLIPPNYNTSEMIAKIREIRSKSFDQRNVDLFMEIDQLGHYTQSRWFDNLNRHQYIRYIRILRDLWFYRAAIPLDIKMKICPLWDPFVIMTAGDAINYNELNDVQIKLLCISIMEDMVYTGIDNEHKMLGAFQVLSALTIVSVDARNNMLWLYESLLY